MRRSSGGIGGTAFVQAADHNPLVVLGTSPIKVLAAGESVLPGRARSTTSCQPS
jgi:hypothetical protein